MRGGSKRWIIGSMAKRRNLPGWGVLFYDGKVNSYGGKGDAAEYLCHLGEGDRGRMCEVCSSDFFVAIRRCYIIIVVQKKVSLLQRSTFS
jgi:hypothetical protein